MTMITMKCLGVFFFHPGGNQLGTLLPEKRLLVSLLAQIPQLEFESINNFSSSVQLTPCWGGGGGLFKLSTSVRTGIVIYLLS